MTARPDTGDLGPTLGDRAKWLINAGPSDYLLALSVASTSLPVVGRHLEPLGGMTAMSLWGIRHMPDFVGAAVKSWTTRGVGEIRKRDREMTNEVVRGSLRGVVTPEALDVDWPLPDNTPPVWKAFEHRKDLYRGSVRYGDHPSQLLDVWRRDDLPATPAPVMIFLPGGAWVHGSRILQGYALMSHMASLGWVCLSIDYRVAPNHAWPQHIVDVKTAIAWARANVDKFGGDRSFVTIAGTSAGGHLAALAGLTPGDPEYDASLPEGSDTSVDAVVGIYGRYDWEDRSTVERDRFVDFLERVVVKRTIDKRPDVFRKASPIARTRPDAPPFYVLHGSGDSVIPVQQARDFVERLKATSHSVVAYAELPGAGHGFDMTDGARTVAASTAIGLFLNQIRRNQLLATAKRVI